MSRAHFTDSFSLHALEKREVFDTSISGVPQQILDAGADIQSAVTADFNGDGRADIALASGRNVLVLLARASGGFATPVVTPLGATVGKLAVAKLNADGLPDLVALGGSVTGSQQSVLRALSNLNGGRFELSDRVFLPSSGTRDATVSAANLNGDARDEIVVTTVSGDTGTMRAFTFGPRGFGAATVLAQASSALVKPAFYDLNHDGHTDIVTARNELTRSPQIGRVVALVLPGRLGPVTELTLATRPGRIDSLLHGDLRDGRGERLIVAFTEPDDQSLSFSLPGDSVVQSIAPDGEGLFSAFDELARRPGGELFVFGEPIRRSIVLLGLMDSNTDGAIDLIAEERLQGPTPTAIDGGAVYPTITHRETQLLQLLGGPRDGDGLIAVAASHSVGGRVAFDSAASNIYAPRYLVSQFTGGPAADLLLFDNEHLRIARSDGANKAPVIGRVEGAEILPAVVGAFGFKVEGVFDPDAARSAFTRGRVQSVRAYFDSNNNGKLDAADALLAIDDDGSDGWNFGGIYSPGEKARRFLIVAQDDQGMVSRMVTYPTSVPPRIDLRPLV